MIEILFLKIILYFRYNKEFNIIEFKEKYFTYMIFYIYYR